MLKFGSELSSRLSKFASLLLSYFAANSLRRHLETCLANEVVGLGDEAIRLASARIVAIIVFASLVAANCIDTIRSWCGAFRLA